MISSRILSALSAAVLLVGVAAFAHAGETHAKPAAPADYPLTTCVVSGDKLGGDMGKAVEYAYKQAGQPDRLILLCCKDCIKDFEKEPAKFVKSLDEAAAAKAKNANKP